ncbi:hypothetical protein [Micromonospora sp. NPDC023814]|uniref:hypothetical protein n=1 Tax=Micromonospora sp. NPDC023814 TaxID=3154596 RepID=UPI0033DF6E00
MLIAPVPTPSPTAVVSPSPALTDAVPSQPASLVPTPSATRLVEVVEHSTGFFDKITPGSWPDWLAAIGTSAAFLVAAFTYARSIRERRESQARLVYSKLVSLKFHEPGTEFEMMPHDARYGWTETGVGTLPPSSPDEKARYIALVPVIQLTAAVHNGSKELIAPAKVQVVNTGRKTTYDAFAVTVNSVDPESEEKVDFIWPNVDHPGQPGLGTTVIFRDAAGRWWRRHLAEPIEAVHDDPENGKDTPAQRARWAANARAMGLDPSPEPEVPLRARWHRFWRKRRGKSPTP